MTYLQMQLGFVNHITSFAQLLVSAFRFIGNVQRDISRYIQVNKYKDCYGIFTLLSFTNIINLRGLLDPTWNFWISTPFRNKKRLIIKIEKVKEDNRKFFILFFSNRSISVSKLIHRFKKIVGKIFICKYNLCLELNRLSSYFDIILDHALGACAKKILYSF